MAEKEELLALYNQIHSEITRYRNLEYQYVLWQIGLTYGILYVRSEYLKDFIDDDFKLFIDIGIILIIISITFLFSYHMMFSHYWMNQNNLVRKQLESSLKLTPKVNEILSNRSFMAKTRGWVYPFLFFMWVSALSICYYIGYQNPIPNWVYNLNIIAIWRNTTPFLILILTFSFVVLCLIQLKTAWKIFETFDKGFLNKYWIHFVFGIIISLIIYSYWIV